MQVDRFGAETVRSLQRYACPRNREFKPREASLRFSDVLSDLRGSLRLSPEAERIHSFLGFGILKNRAGHLKTAT
jgi:hypothetical protein